MNPFHVFIIRAIVGLGIASLLSRFFFQVINPVSVGLLAIFLVGMSYVSQYFRNRTRKD